MALIGIGHWSRESWIDTGKNSIVYSACIDFVPFISMTVAVKLSINYLLGCIDFYKTFWESEAFSTSFSIPFTLYCFSSFTGIWEMDRNVLILVLKIFDRQIIVGTQKYDNDTPIFVSWFLYPIPKLIWELLSTASVYKILDSQIFVNKWHIQNLGCDSITPSP